MLVDLEVDVCRERLLTRLDGLGIRLDKCQQILRLVWRMENYGQRRCAQRKGRIVTSATLLAYSDLGVTHPLLAGDSGRIGYELLSRKTLRAPCRTVGVGGILRYGLFVATQEMYIGAAAHYLDGRQLDTVSVALYYRSEDEGLVTAYLKRCNIERHVYGDSLAVVVDVKVAYFSLSVHYLLRRHGQRCGRRKQHC